MPPIAAAFTPTLASGDASELLPPLLAPQGWAGAQVGAALGQHGVYGVHSKGIGGCFVEFDVNQVARFHLSVGANPGVTLGLLPIQQNQPGVLSTFGVDQIATAATPLAATDGFLHEGFGNYQPTKPIFVPPGSFLYVYAHAPSLVWEGTMFIRDVPAGLAPD
jgi:hypothetical protein